MESDGNIYCACGCKLTEHYEILWNICTKCVDEFNNNTDLIENQYEKINNTIITNNSNVSLVTKDF